jgi:putative tryptophan/tyrosine transport system substrate-binding protein
MTNARRAVARLAIATLCFVAALPAMAQQATKVPRIAYVWLATAGPSAPHADAFRQRMAELGWVEGKNFRVDYIDAGGNRAKLDEIMEGLVRDKVDLIVAMCTPEALSAKKFTTTIPVVMAATGDPVAAGLVESLAHPGGNITGVSMMSLPLSAKRVELLKQTFPKLTQTTVLWNPARPDNVPEVKTMQDAATRLGLKSKSNEIRSRDELALVLAGISADGSQSLLNAGDPLLASEARAITDLAAKMKIPALYDDRIFVDNGGLMSYGADLGKLHKRAADYVDKILKGAKPGDLPIEQPTQFELVINKRTAKALGLTIPNTILVQATEVIE